MMMVYNHINDAWNKIDCFIGIDRMNISKRMITLDRHLFHVQITYC